MIVKYYVLAYYVLAAVDLLAMPFSSAVAQSQAAATTPRPFVSPVLGDNMVL